MNLTYVEKMEGAPNVGAAALVFEMPTRPSTGHDGERADAARARKRRGKARVSPESTLGSNERIARSHIMRSLFGISVIAAALLSLGVATAALAQDQGPSASKVEVSLLGGIHAFNKNDTALPDNLIGVPAVASVAYRITPTLAAEGEFTWLIPVQQSVDVGSGPEQDRKAPNTLAYQVGLRGNLQLSTWSPYLAAGLGGITFLSNSEADRLPRLDKSQTMFALNFGGGGQFAINPRWGVRADFRELVGFPGNDAAGLSTNGSADPIWLERGTVGVDYKF